MNRNIWIIVLFGIGLHSCTDQGEKEFVDEAHRPQDWKAKFHLNLLPDTETNEEEKINAIDHSENTKVYDLVDQLFDLAFSGDAKVYLPGVFGDLDPEQVVDPMQLQKALESYDTTSVEDLYSLGFVDTVVDMSFRKSAVSIVQINCAFRKQGNQIMAIPLHVMIGEQIFSDQGSFRGYKPRFFIELNHQELKDMNLTADLNIATDSLGLFKINSLEAYHEDESQPIHDLLMMDNAHQAILKLKIGFSFSRREMMIDPFEVKLESYTEKEV